MSGAFWLSSWLLLGMLLLSGCQSSKLETTEDSDGEWAFSWDNLERRIIKLTDEAMLSENPSKLYRLKSRVIGIHTGEHTQQAAKRAYWTAVLNTNLIFVEQEHGQSDQVLRLLDESIELLEQTNYDTAETNALLAMLYRTKIDHDRTQTFELFSKMQDALDVAINADSTNLRVLLAQIFIGVAPVRGFSIDVDIQACIDVALTSTYDAQGDALSPSWGLPQIYTLAIGYLMEAEKLVEASDLVAEAIEKFPDDSVLRYWARLFQIELETSDE